MIVRSVLRRWLDRFNLDDLLPRVTLADHAYAGCRLYTLNNKLRGSVLEAAAKEHDQLSHPSSLIRTPGEGADRQCALACDWLRISASGNITRVEHKSSQVRWNDRGRHWSATFYNIKPQLHDELQCSFWAPSVIYSFVHDRESKVSSNGSRTDVCGYNVFVSAPAGVLDLSIALHHIVSKAPAMGRVSSYPTDGPVIRSAIHSSASFTYKVYAELKCPLHTLSSVIRGRLLESIGRRFDTMRYRCCIVEDADPSFGVDGRSLPKHTRPYDWKRISTHGHSIIRVEYKSAQVAWDTNKSVWQASWYGIKDGSYDELQLTLYSPWALRTFVHDGVTGLTSMGRFTNVRGRSIVISGPHGNPDLEAALNVITSKASAAFGAPIWELR